MRKPAPVDCPRCDTTMVPEKIGDGLYLCACCAKTFTVPKGLRSA